MFHHHWFLEVSARLALQPLSDSITFFHFPHLISQPAHLQSSAPDINYHQPLAQAPNMSLWPWESMKLSACNRVCVCKSNPGHADLAPFFPRLEGRSHPWNESPSSVPAPFRFLIHPMGNQPSLWPLSIHLSNHSLQDAVTEATRCYEFCRWKTAEQLLEGWSGFGAQMDSGPWRALCLDIGHLRS